MKNKIITKRLNNKTEVTNNGIRIFESITNNVNLQNVLRRVDAKSIMSAYKSGIEVTIVIIKEVRDNFIWDDDYIEDCLIEYHFEDNGLVYFNWSKRLISLSSAELREEIDRRINRTLYNKTPCSKKSYSLDYKKTKQAFESKIKNILAKSKQTVKNVITSKRIMIDSKLNQPHFKIRGLTTYEDLREKYNPEFDAFFNILKNEFKH